MSKVLLGFLGGVIVATSLTVGAGDRNWAADETNRMEQQQKLNQLYMDHEQRRNNRQHNPC